MEKVLQDRLVVILKVSVIVPIYNAEKYIEKCLNSLVNQVLQNIEIICVNDGSTDNSMITIRRYANKDSRIKIIEQENLKFLKAHNCNTRDKDFWAIKKDYKKFGIRWYQIKESLHTEKHLLFGLIPVRGVQV